MWFARRPGLRWGGLCPLPGTGSQRVLTVRGWVSCWWDGACGRGDMAGCGPGWLGCAVAVSGRWLWGGGAAQEAPSAGARSLGLLGLALLWRSSVVLPGPLPAAACHPPLPWQYVHPAVSPRAGDSGPAQGPVQGARGGARRGQTPAGEGVPVAGPGSGSLRAASRGPQLGSRPLGLLPGCPDPRCAGTRAGTHTGRRAGGCGGWPSACVRPVS